ncbi:MAG: glycosyltransferase family 9 protein [Alphaproteobacteria bacterium]|nr:glycosyltransferase family 9 protein [Alphaproteobacteria bacterium]
MAEPATPPPSQPSRTPLAAFSTSADFRFSQSNASPRAAQQGRAGERHVTSSRAFLNNALRRDARFRILGNVTLPCLARGVWPTHAFAGQRVLFLLPSPALGSNVSTALFLDAFAARHRPKALGVFCAESATDIYFRAGLKDVFALFVAERELRRWDVIVDLGMLESRRDVELWPVDMEAELNAAFALAPGPRYAAAPRALPQRRLRIGLLPLASSPLRTLPLAATQALLEPLLGFGELTLCLNRFQQQGVLYARELAPRLPKAVKLIDAFASIGALLDAVAGFDYLVLADSGPAHMTKLHATPGVAVYSSAPAEVLQGRFRNLAAFHVRFAGPHCRAPCGLAKLRETADGRIGCMGSLSLPLAELPKTPKRQDPALVEHLLLAAPVPCVAALAADPAPLVAFVLADLAGRGAIPRAS